MSRTRLVILWMSLCEESFHGIGVVSLRILGAWEFSVRRTRGGRFYYRVMRCANFVGNLLTLSMIEKLRVRRVNVAN